MADVEALRLSDWVIAGCTLLGPVLAVQAQKWVEGFREQRARRLTIFRRLMATRAQNLNPAHVEALNAVPIDFYKDKKVMDAWEEYFICAFNCHAIQHRSDMGTEAGPISFKTSRCHWFKGRLPV